MEVLDTVHNPGQSSKRKRVQHACDNCRRKRSRCGGPQIGQDSCIECDACNQVCTFTADKIRPSRSQIEALEEKIKVYEKLLAEAVSGLQQNKHHDLDILTESDVNNVAYIGTRPFDHSEGKFIQSRIEEEGKDGPFCYLGASSPFHIVPVIERELGTASTAQLLLVSQKQQQQNHNHNHHHNHNHQETGSRQAGSGSGSALLSLTETDNRASTTKHIVDNAWPSPSAEALLVNAYFSRLHWMYPLLCESTFRQQLRTCRQQDNVDQLSVAFALFAAASRFVDDDHLMLPDVQGKARPSCESIGANWYSIYKQLSSGREWQKVSLEYIQGLLLLVIYLMGTQLSNTIAWSTLGRACRMLQSVGAHRNLTAVKLSWTTLQSQQWTMAWWVAYTLDREQASVFGRPLAIRDEDFDVQYPQTNSKVMRRFTASLQLDEIIGRALVALYGPHTSIRRRMGDAAGKEVLTHFDSRLNQWQRDHAEECQPSSDDDDDNNEDVGSSSTHNRIIQAKFLFCQLLVHRTFALNSQSESSKVALKAATGMVDTMYSLTLYNQLHASGHLGCSRTIEATCMLLVFLARNCELRQACHSDTVESVIKSMDLLRVFGKRWSVGGGVYQILHSLCTKLGINIGSTTTTDSYQSSPPASSGFPVQNFDEHIDWTAMFDFMIPELSFTDDTSFTSALFAHPSLTPDLTAERSLNDPPS